MPRHGNFDSNGPEGRVRGNAHQVYEKYVALARDALSAGDRISAETYYQHAEHYYRIVNARTDPKPNGEGQSGRRGGNGQAEAGDEQPRREPGMQPVPAATGGEQPQEAPQAEEPPAASRRRRPRQAKAAEPQPDPQPDVSPDVQPSEDGEPAEA